VTVTDDDTGVGVVTTSVLVKNVAPNLTLDTTGAIAFAGGNAFVGRKGVSQNHSATATDVGSDDLTFNWSFPPFSYTEVATYYNNGVSPDPLPSPAGVFPFSATDGASVTFSAPGVYTVSVQVVDDDGGSDSDSLSKLVTGDCECARTQGYWRHQFSGKGKQHIDNATLQAYLNIVGFASGVFSESVPASTLAQAKAIFLPGGDGDSGPSNMRGKANAQALAAWLNFASGAVGWNELVPVRLTEDGPTVTMTFSAAMAQVEAILLNPSASHSELVKAKSIAASINEMDEHNGACGDDDDDDDDDRDDDKGGKGDSSDKKDDKGGKDSNNGGNGGGSSGSGDKKDDGKKPVAAPPSGSNGKGKGK
jgi:hypothetical protein